MKDNRTLCIRCGWPMITQIVDEETREIRWKCDHCGHTAEVNI
jgi:DNA-directed RNA polymerase subunit RPC12/RpoP